MPIKPGNRNTERKVVRLARPFRSRTRCEAMLLPYAPESLPAKEPGEPYDALQRPSFIALAQSQPVCWHFVALFLRLHDFRLGNHTSPVGRYLFIGKYRIPVLISRSERSGRTLQSSLERNNAYLHYFIYYMIGSTSWGRSADRRKPKLCGVTLPNSFHQFFA